MGPLTPSVLIFPARGGKESEDRAANVRGFGVIFRTLLGSSIKETTIESRLDLVIGQYPCAGDPRAHLDRIDWGSSTSVTVVNHASMTAKLRSTGSGALRRIVASARHSSRLYLAS